MFTLTLENHISSCKKYMSKSETLSSEGKRFLNLLNVVCMSSLTILTGPLFAGTQYKYHMTQNAVWVCLLNSLIGVCAVCIYPHSSFRVVHWKLW